jgi:hypothetical protein
MLETQLIPLPLDLGRNTKQDSKLVDVQYSLNTENVDYSIIGTVKKTNGFESLISRPFTSGVDAKSMHSDEDDLVILARKGEYKQQTGIVYTEKWNNEKEFIIPVNVSSFPVKGDTSDNNEKQRCTVAVDSTNDVAVYCSVYMNGSNFYNTIEFEDINTGHRQNLFRNMGTPTAINFPQMFTHAASQTAFMLYKKDNDLILDYMAYGASEIAGSITLDTTADDDYCFSGYSDGTTLTVCYFDSSATAGNAKIIALAATPVVTSTISFTAANACENLNEFTVCQLVPFTGGRWAFFYPSATANRYIVIYFNSSFVIQAQAGFTLTHPIYTISAAASDLASPSDTLDFLVVAGSTAIGVSTTASPTIDVVRIAYVANTITRPYTSQVLDLYVPSSQIFGGRYFTAKYQSGANPVTDYLMCLQNTTVGSIVPVRMHPIARFNELQAAKNLYISQVGQDSFGNYYSMTANQLSQGSGTKAVKFWFGTNDENSSNNKYGKSLCITGGFMSEFDGTSLMENGFHTVPGLVAQQFSTGGLIAAGTYNYQVIYAYIDGKGQLSRSAPSPIVATTTTGSTSSVELTVRRLSSGQKQLNGYFIYVYRTLAGGSVFYLANKTYVPGNSIYSAVNEVILDTLNDGAIDQNEIIYTQGGVIPNDPAPSYRYSTVIQDRMIIAGLEDPNSILFSKAYLIGESPNFSLEFELRTDAGMVGGSDPITGLGSFDDKFIIFKANYIFYVQGNFPNELGQQYGLSLPILISADTGCINSKTIVNYPGGLMFQSSKGWYSLNQGMQLQYIGEGAEDFNNVTIESGAIYPEKNQVRYVQANGAMLCYDWLVGKWFTRTNGSSPMIDIWNNKFVILRDSSGCLVEVEGQGFTDYDVVDDEQDYFPMRIETSWIKMSGVQNFGRIRKAEILGKFISGHTLRINVYYDYDTSYVETYDYTHDALTGIYQTKIHLRKQKCQSVKFELFDISQSGSGESMQLTNLTIEVGVRKGMFKNNPAKQE